MFMYQAYKNNNRDSESNIVLQQYEIESKPKILISANDTPFVWADIDKLLRLDETDIYKAFSIFRFCDGATLDLKMKGKRALLKNLPEMSGNRISLENAKRLIDVGLLDLTIERKYRTTQEFISLGKEYFLTKSSDLSDNIPRKTRFYLKAVSAQYRQKAKTPVPVSILKYLHQGTNILCENPDEPNVLKAGVYQFDLTQDIPGEFMRYVPVATLDAAHPIIFCNVVDPRLFYAGNSIEAATIIGRFDEFNHIYNIGF